jgi:5-hydroxyisourate hydrolase
MITTHVLDTAAGEPAAGMAVVLEIYRSSDWVRLSSGRTDQRGRLVAMAENADAGPGIYRFTFDTGDYHRRMSLKPFFPEVQVMFTVQEAGEHVHIPLLISPFSYSTYRGS